MKTLYRTQKREVSSNMIEFSDNDGKSWHPLLLPVTDKKIGDALGVIILEFLEEEGICIDSEEGMLYDGKI